MALFIKLQEIPELIKAAQENFPNVYFNTEGKAKWIDPSILSYLNIQSVYMYIADQKHVISADTFIGETELVNKDEIIKTFIASSIPPENYLISGEEEITN